MSTLSCCLPHDVSLQFLSLSRMGSVAVEFSCWMRRSDGEPPIFDACSIRRIRVQTRIRGGSRMTGREILASTQCYEFTSTNPIQKKKKKKKTNSLRIAIYSPLHQPQTWVFHATPATSVRQPVRRGPSTVRRGMMRTAHFFQEAVRELCLTGFVFCIQGVREGSPARQHPYWHQENSPGPHSRW